jgi:hypothetical protein
MVSIIVNSPTFKHEFAMRRAIQENIADQRQVDEDDTVEKTLKEGARKAAEKLVGLIDSDEESISVKSCAEVLDRSGHGRVKEAQVPGGPTIIINTDDAKIIQQTIEMEYGDKRPAGAESRDSEAASKSS